MIKNSHPLQRVVTLQELVQYPAKRLIQLLDEKQSGKKPTFANAAPGCGKVGDHPDIPAGVGNPLMKCWRSISKLDVDQLSWLHKTHSPFFLVTHSMTTRTSITKT
jgi:hypothetical protein